MNLTLLFLFGATVGVVSGLLGIGGGVLLVPGLVLLFGFSQPEAQGTSLAVLALPILIFAAVVYYQNGHVRLPVAGVVAAGFAVGAYAGARFVPHVPAIYLRTGFGGLLLYLGFLFVVSPATGRSAAALPAGVAAVVTAVLGFVLRRKRQARPTREDVEYHI